MAEQRLERARRRIEVLRGSFPDLTRVAERPAAYVRDGALTGDDRRRLAQVLDEAVGGSTPTCAVAGSLRRDVHGVTVDLDASSGIGRRLVERLSSELRIEPAIGSHPRLRRYGAGNVHGLHLDQDDRGPVQLVATVILVIEATDDIDGGATTFPLARPVPLAIAPVTGRLIAWADQVAGSGFDPLSLHESDLVRRGVKSTFTWFAYANVDECAFLNEGPLRTPHRCRSTEGSR